MTDLDSHFRFTDIALPVVDSKGLPVQEVGQPLSSVPLDDALPPVELDEIMHVVAKLVDRLVETDRLPVHDVDAVGLGIADLVPHEAAESWKQTQSSIPVHDQCQCQCLGYLTGWSSRSGCP